MLASPDSARSDLDRVQYMLCYVVVWSGCTIFWYDTLWGCVGSMSMAEANECLTRDGSVCTPTQRGTPLLCMLYL